MVDTAASPICYACNFVTYAWKIVSTEIVHAIVIGYQISNEHGPMLAKKAFLNRCQIRRTRDLNLPALFVCIFTFLLAFGYMMMAKCCLVTQTLHFNGCNELSAINSNKGIFFLVSA